MVGCSNPVSVGSFFFLIEGELRSLSSSSIRKKNRGSAGFEPGHTRPSNSQSDDLLTELSRQVEK